MRVLGPGDSPAHIVIAPGDMGKMADEAYAQIAAGIAARGLAVAVFDAPTLPAGEVGADDRLAELTRAAADLAKPGQWLVIGGLSRGARVCASLVGELRASALLGFAYPFHSRRDPEAGPRVAQLAALTVPVWLGQGTRDSHGNREQVRGYGLPGHVRVHWLEDANHALRPRLRSGYTAEDQLDAAVADACTWLSTLHR